VTRDSHIYNNNNNRCGYGMAVGYFTDVVIHSSKNYHQESATELRRLSKEVAAACGVVSEHFHGVSPLYQ